MRDGERAARRHEDIDRSYGDVMPLAEVLAYVAGVGARNAAHAV
jgi:hypothetical protein